MDARVPFSQLRTRANRLLEVARGRRVLLTKRGRIVEARIVTGDHRILDYADDAMAFR